MRSCRRFRARALQQKGRKRQGDIVMTRESQNFHDMGGRRTSIEAPSEEDESVEQAVESHIPQAPVEEPDPDPAQHPPVDEPEHPRTPSNPPRRKSAARKRRR
jgi:outer membrane biosynthesis protein TonB